MPTIFTILHNFLYAAAGIGGISILIFFHELGHFLFCKLFGVYTPSFSIGFGPVIWSKMIGTTNFIISAIPLGGYVEIGGMADSSAENIAQSQVPQQSLFSAKFYYQKVLILLGGILFNLLFAYGACTIVYMAGSPGSVLLYPETATTTVQQVIPESPAALSGIMPGDRLVAFNETSLNSQALPLLQHLEQKPQSINLTLLRENSELSIQLSLQEKRTGIIFQCREQPSVGLLAAFYRGIGTTHRWIKDTAYGLIHIFSKRDLSAAGGPIKIISMISKSAADGFLIYLLFLAIISINLALFNLLPVPILDGGQLVLVTIETVLRRQLPQKAREYLFIGTWLFFIGIIIILSCSDLKQLLMPYFTSVKECIGNG